jgi:hypothetical protein
MRNLTDTTVTGRDAASVVGPGRQPRSSAESVVVRPSGSEGSEGTSDRACRRVEASTRGGKQHGKGRGEEAGKEPALGVAAEGVQNRNCSRSTVVAAARFVESFAGWARRAGSQSVIKCHAVLPSMYALPCRTWKKRCGSGSSVASADSVMLSMDHWDTGSPLPTLEGRGEKQAGCRRHRLEAQDRAGGEVEGSGTGQRGKTGHVAGLPSKEDPLPPYP